jgi:hypothetical protein
MEQGTMGKAARFSVTFNNVVDDQLRNFKPIAPNQDIQITHDSVMASLLINLS